ncbi:putative acid anhydride hydrolase [Pichia kluyveri]|uniref:Cation-transporting ATPase n=1 Tax=Pichia kluyveri TaxID=36015 RepID=A0AAV5R0M6_PICKL|nr:putative acid anhydride hydrolase [Pichia kluyveri]
MPKRSHNNNNNFEFDHSDPSLVSTSYQSNQQHHSIGISRHRDSMTSGRSSRSSSTNRYLNSNNLNHLDENNTEMFSGAASNVVPSSISSFHHHSHLRSPSVISQNIDTPNVDQLILDSDSINTFENINHKKSLNDLTSFENDENLAFDGYESESNDLHERSNFRFFKTEDIESAKGVSSRMNNHLENVKIDYDTNWNSFADDYPSDAYSIDENYDQQSFPTSKSKLVNDDNASGNNSDNSYGSINENPYSEFFRGDAERELIADEEQDLHIYGEEGDEDYEGYEDMITKKEWEKTMKKRESLKLHDLFFKKFPAKNKNQRFYIAEEDLVVGIAGYQTTWSKLILYYILCISTFGLAALIFRWIPRWRIKLMGVEVPLAKAEWLVVEDEYGLLEMPTVDRKWYNRNMSTFLLPKKVESLDDEEVNNDNNSNTDNNNNIDNNIDTKSYTSRRTGMSNKTYTIDDIDPIVPILISFEYRYMKLFYDPLDDLFKLPTNWIDEKWCHYPDIKDGITETNYKLRKMIFGDNIINIVEKSISKLLVDEILHPFYVFQIFSIFLWLADNYYYYAFCIFLISVFSITESLIETRSALKRMRKMSRFQCDVRVWRSGFWKEICSDDLVPGDIYEVSDPSLTVFPCDSLLLSGDAIVNEAMLTGESVPVSKISISSESVKDIEAEFNDTKFSNKFSKSFLYNGTKIVRVRYGVSEDGNGNDPATALVVRTGFNTTKGALVRSMLFPKPSGFKFYEDSFKYIGVMTGIACIGFIFSTINFIKLGLDWSVIILRALDLITIVVPPALPATLTIGTNFALTRLRQSKIFCIAPMRVNIGGKLDVLCFDKTGTLTEESLDIMGIHISKPINDRKVHEFTDMFKKSNDIENSRVVNSDKIFASMLSCHSLKKINDKPVGDPLDENMFEFVGWDMIEDRNESVILSNFLDSRKLLTLAQPILFTKNNVSDYYVQLKEFEFISQLRRMSVICLKSNTGTTNYDEDELNVFVKGAPEVIETICTPDSIPDNFNELLYNYTHNGYRIIACAAKKLKNPTKNPTDLSFVGDLKRDDIEKDLEFIGFIVFENKLKDSTTDTIEQLTNADLRTVMCTGDNILTAVSVGRECKIIKPNSKVFIPTFDYESFPDNYLDADGNEIEGRFSNTHIPPIIWSEVDNPDLQLDRVTLSPLDINQDDNYCLAITGDVFKFILTELVDMEYFIEMILMKCSIFARMSPDEKHELVNQLQKIDYTVGFCGDGANDCGALKAADVGVSLSEAEASVAAPFTSHVFEISCVLDIIKEGRSSLVTSFSCFQYMSLYSAIQFISVTLLYKEGSNLGDFQFLYIDLFLIIPIAVFMSWSKPYDKIVTKKPTANLISPKIIIPLLGNIVLLLLGQFIAWKVVKSQNFPWYIEPIPGTDDQVQSTDNTLLFFFSNFQYILIALILTAGPPYREEVTKNYPFIITIIIELSISVGLMTVDPSSNFGDLMDLTWMSFEVKLWLFVGAFVNLISLYLGDKYFFDIIAKLIKRFVKGTKSNKKFKRLKREFKTLV